MPVSSVGHGGSCPLTDSVYRLTSDQGKSAQLWTAGTQNCRFYQQCSVISTWTLPSRTTWCTSGQQAPTLGQAAHFNEVAKCV